MTQLCPPCRAVGTQNFTNKSDRFSLLGITGVDAEGVQWGLQPPISAASFNIHRDFNQKVGYHHINTLSEQNQCPFWKSCIRP